MVFRWRTKATVRVIYFFIRRQYFFTTILYGYYAYVQCTRIIHKLSKHKFNSTGVYLRYNIFILFYDIIIMWVLVCEFIEQNLTGSRAHIVVYIEYRLSLLNIIIFVYIYIYIIY